MSTPSKPYSETMLVTEETKLGMSCAIVELEILAASSEGDHHLLALALEICDVGFQLVGIDAAGRAECRVPSGALLSGEAKATMITSHCGETSCSGNGVLTPLNLEPVQ